MHTVPTLYGCNISVTGMASDERKRISLLIESHGGTFCPDLHSSCTHLLVSEETINDGKSTPKIVYARKWGVSLVRMAWLHECVERRVCLDSLPFSADGDVQWADTLPGPLADDRNGLRLSFPYSELTVEEVNQVKNVPPYLENAHIYVGNSLPGEKLLLLKRIILKAGGTRHSDLFDPSLITHYVIHNQTLSPKDVEQLKLFGDSLPTIVHDQWLFACFYAKERLPVEKYAVDQGRLLQYSQSQEFKHLETPSEPAKGKASTSWSLKHAALQPKLESPTVVQQQPFTPPSHPLPFDSLPAAQAKENSVLPILSGYSFCLLYEHVAPIKAAQLTELVEKNGGAVGEVADADYYLAPLIIPQKPKITKPMYNEIWLNEVLRQGRVIEDTDQEYTFHYSPLVVSHEIQTEEFASMKISITGFAGLDREFYSRLITALGATYTENLSKKNTHLIASLPTGPKYEFATTVGIVTVSRDWLLESAREGIPLDCSLYPAVAMGMGTVPATVVNNEIPLTLTTPGVLKRAAVDSSVAADTLVAQKGEACTSSQVSSRPETMRCPRFLSGLTFAISQRLWHRRDELHDLVTELGGIFVWSYDSTCTHYLHQGNMVEESFREFKMVRQHGKWIVSPWWLVRSQEAGRKLPETSFPHTFNPSDELVRPISPTIPELKEAGYGDGSKDLAPIGVFSPADSIPTIDFDSLLAADQERRVAKKPTISYNYSGTSTAIANVEAEPEAQERVFAVSGVTPDQRSVFPSVIMSLGGKVLKSSSNWDSSATHLIIGGLTKSEKFLAACAAGVWILRPDYLTECSTAERFLDEDRFEWQPSWCDDPLARAPRFWRCEARKGKRPFRDWHVLLVSDQKRLNSLKAILEAGEAKVWTLSGSEDMEALNLSHILVSSAQMRAKIPKPILEKHHNRIHNVELIAEHLLNVSDGR